MNQGNKRDISILSNKALRLLAEEVDNLMTTTWMNTGQITLSYIGRKP
jgi:hypothetical protein